MSRIFFTCSQPISIAYSPKIIVVISNNTIIVLVKSFTKKEHELKNEGGNYRVTIVASSLVEKLVFLFLQNLKLKKIILFLLPSTNTTLNTFDLLTLL